MDIEASPSIDDAARRALAVALMRTSRPVSASRPYDRAWRHAALFEAVDRDGRDADYAFSPRSTRGATRA